MALRDVQAIENDLAVVRAEAKILVADGLHFSPEFESLVTRNKLLRIEKQKLLQSQKDT